MNSNEARTKIGTEMLRKYLEKDEVYDYLTFINRENPAVVSTSGIETWIKMAKKVLTEEEYERFIKKVYPLDGNTPEVLELKEKLKDIATRIAKNKATMYDVFDELGMTMSQYIYYIKRLRFRQKEIGASVYADNSDYYNKVSSYLKAGELTSTYPTLGKEMHNRLIAFIEEHDLPVNNVTYVEAYDTFKHRGIIKLNQTR